MQYQIRINKYIASSGLTSRRGADELIKSGRVKVNDKVITEPGLVITAKDIVQVDNKKLGMKEKKYVILNKPAGYVTTRNDPQNRRTIYDLLPSDLHYLVPAGRLDKDSSGLLILTNDGDLIRKLTHPSEHVPKIYKVTVEGKLTDQDIRKFKKGIEIEENKIAYANVTGLAYEKNTSIAEIILYQGYNRQIRRMMDIIEHPVISLKRIAQANITLSGLKKGKYRFLAKKEVTDLFNYLKKIKPISSKEQL